MTFFTRILRYTLLLWLLLDRTKAQDQDPPPRVFTPDELRVANGVDSDKLYLALFGRVYDVSAGDDYYGPEGGYHIFSGHDAPVPFITGIFTEEEAAKSWTTLETKQHGGLLSWVEFYEKEEKYPFLGVMQGEFYDAEGKPLPELAKVQEAMAAAKEVQKQREIERQRKVAAREAKRKANMQPIPPRRMVNPVQQEQQPKMTTATTGVGAEL
eukprot:scaffold521_cov167-Amphora_coffeaeformis.AAC.22